MILIFKLNDKLIFLHLVDVNNETQTTTDKEHKTVANEAFCIVRNTNYKTSVR